MDELNQRKIGHNAGHPRKYTGKVNTPAAPPLSQKILPNMAPRTRAVLCAAAVFIAALALRLLYLKQLSASYFFAPFSGGLDDYIFDNWALEILKGNWLGDGTIYIYRMPLYVYFLSLVYFIAGHSYWIVYILQALLGSATCVLVYLIGSEMLDRPSGLIAGFLTALYGPFIFYGGMLVGETLSVFVTCLAFLLLAIFRRTRRTRLLFSAGVLLGISMLARGNILIVLPFMFLWIYLFSRKNVSVRPVRGIITLAAGVLIAVSPIMIRNYVQEKDIVPITALGGLNVYIGNAYGADGKYRTVEHISSNAGNMIRNSIAVAENLSGRPLKPSEVSNFWIRETLRSVKEDGPGYLVPLIWKKLVLCWNAYEIPDIWDYYFFRRYLPVLTIAAVSFSLLGPLALLGIYLARVEKRDLSLLYLFAFGYILSLVVVFVTSRYRMQMVPLLGLLGAYAVVHVKRVILSKRGRGVTCLVILTAGIVFCNLPVKKVSFETSFNSLGILLKRSGRIDEAIEVYTTAIDTNPHYATPYYNLGILYRDTGRRGLAREYLKKAVEIAPDFELARRKLAELG